jgi:hypothetical protein
LQDIKCDTEQRVKDLAKFRRDLKLGAMQTTAIDNQAHVFLMGTAPEGADNFAPVNKFDLLFELYP